MTALRSLLASVGVALAALGIAFLVVPDAAGALGLPRLGVVLLGAIALVEGIRSLVARRRTGIDGAATGNPEHREATALPGDGFDERVAGLGRTRTRRWRGGQAERLRRRLEAAAVEATATRWRLSTEAARERVVAGEWTDDPAAAWFLGGSEVPRPPWSTRARAVLAAEPSTGYYAIRTADAVVALREGA